MASTSNPAATRESRFDNPYSLYLVTDSSEAILGKRDLIEVVEQALLGGVSTVQYREKKLEAKAMVGQCIKLRDLCHKHGAKFIVNDRVDVAFASGADGVHLGQDDIGISHARQILGQDAIIGISCSTVDEALVAIQEGADYLGIGAVYATPTKSNVSGILGISGIHEIISAISRATIGGKHVPCVAIGGLNAGNIQLLLYKTSVTNGYLDGVAIVSAIMAAESPKDAAGLLRGLWSDHPPWKAADTNRVGGSLTNSHELQSQLAEIARKVTTRGPISHNMTNIVVANFTANVALAAGISPIMSKAKDEVKDLAKLGGGLVINIGTSTPDELPTFIAGVQAYNEVAGPVLLDPVGCGATKMRHDIVTEIMNRGYLDVIKGNESEIQALASMGPLGQKGVDSAPSTSSEQDKAKLVRELANRERCIVLMTGKVDYLSDGETTFAISNGVHNLGSVTGSGCALGALIVAFAAVHKEDKLLATLAAVLFYELAAELAEGSDETRGCGTFVPRLLDALSHLRGDSKLGNNDWTKKAKIEMVEGLR